MSRRPSITEEREEKLDAWHREETHRRALEDIEAEREAAAVGGEGTSVAVPAVGDVAPDALAQFRRLSLQEQMRELVAECKARDESGDG